MKALASGSGRTRKVDVVTTRLFPSIIAETVTIHSFPMAVGLATHTSPERDKLPLLMLALIRLLGTPGTDMLSLLLMPAYNTFIIVLETVAMGSTTVYFCSNGYCCIVPSPRRSSR